MGKVWRRRDHRRTDESIGKPLSQGSNRWNGRRNDGHPAEVDQMGSCTVTKRASQHPRRQNRVCPVQPHNPQTTCSRKAGTPPLAHFRPGHGAYLARFEYLKQYFVLSLNQTLDQIQQWWPDEPSSISDDEMDWQPESEVTIPIPGEVHYVWDPTPANPGELTCGCGALRRGVHLGMLIDIRKKIPSEMVPRTGLGRRDSSGWNLGDISEPSRRSGSSVPIDVRCIGDGS